jgi:hypothetical protein
VSGLVGCGGSQRVCLELGCACSKFDIRGAQEDARRCVRMGGYRWSRALQEPRFKVSIVIGLSGVA